MYIRITEAANELQVDYNTVNRWFNLGLVNLAVVIGEGRPVKLVELDSCKVTKLTPKKRGIKSGPNVRTCGLGWRESKRLKRKGQTPCDAAPKKEND